MSIYPSISVYSYLSIYLSIYLYQFTHIYLSIYLYQFTHIYLSIYLSIYQGSPYNVVANVLDCNIIVSEFKLHLHYYVHFWTNTLGKDMKPFIPSANSITTVLL